MSATSSENDRWLGERLRVDSLSTEAFEALLSDNEALHSTSTTPKSPIPLVPDETSLTPMADILNDMCYTFSNIANCACGNVYDEILVRWYENRSKFICFIEQTNSYKDLLRHRGKFWSSDYGYTPLRKAATLIAGRSFLLFVHNKPLFCAPMANEWGHGSRYVFETIFKQRLQSSNELANGAWVGSFYSINLREHRGCRRTLEMWVHGSSSVKDRQFTIF